MKKEKEKNSPKFTLSGSLHRVRKLKILLDVVIDGKIVQGHEVGYVNLRGAQDPIYLQKATPFYLEYQEKLKDAQEIEDHSEKLEAITDATIDLQLRSVTSAIEDWDKDFFECEFTNDTALEFFRDDKYILVYNQIANYMQKRENFLPLASIQQENG